MADSPLVEDMGNVSLFIKLPGKTENKDKKQAFDVLSVEINREVNKIPWARITIVLTMGTKENDTFKLSSGKDFIPGTEVEILLGYSKEKTSVFKGVITEHSIKARGGSRSTMTLTLRDEAIKLALGAKTKSFKEQTDSAIIGSVIGEAGLGKTVDPTDYTYPQLIQFQEVDWDFIVKRAEANGMIVYPEDGTIMVKKPDFTSAAVLKVDYNQDVYDFDGVIDVTAQLPSAKYEGWDSKTQDFLSGTSEEPEINKQGNIKGKTLAKVVGLADFTVQSTLPLPTEELKAMAAARLLKSRMASMRGRIVFIGNASPKINQLIDISGFGDRFNGSALITRVQHTVIEGSWKTEVGFGLSPDFYHAKSGPSVQDLSPKIKGLQNGVVTNIHEDPDSQYRIEVEIPVTGDKVWARLSNFYSTSERGIFFLPEVNDEVVLGFLGNDPRFPVILGSLYSPKNTPEYTADEENSIKAFVTKGELKIELNDKDKVITINTPGGNEFVLSDEDKSITLTDQNGNKVEMTDAGISLNSAKDIKLDATGNVSITAGQKIDLKTSGGDVTLKGMNVNANGEIGAVVKGGASAELSAGGQTTVKGAMVMIN